MEAYLEEQAATEAQILLMVTGMGQAFNQGVETP